MIDLVMQEHQRPPLPLFEGTKPTASSPLYYVRNCRAIAFGFPMMRENVVQRKLQNMNFHVK